MTDDEATAEVSREAFPDVYKELDRVRRQSREVERAVHMYKIGQIPAYVWEGLAFMAVLALAFLLGYITWQAVNADGHLEYCFVKSDQYYVYLYGYRSWTSNTHIGKFATYDEAVKAAWQTGCPVLK